MKKKELFLYRLNLNDWFKRVFCSLLLQNGKKKKKIGEMFVSTGFITCLSVFFFTPLLSWVMGTIKLTPITSKNSMERVYSLCLPSLSLPLFLRNFFVLSSLQKLVFRNFRGKMCALLRWGDMFLSAQTEEKLWIMRGWVEGWMGEGMEDVILIRLWRCINYFWLNEKRWKFDDAFFFSFFVLLLSFG